jgi:hypothetical protein
MNNLAAYGNSTGNIFSFDLQYRQYAVLCNTDNIPGGAAFSAKNPHVAQTGVLNLSLECNNRS